MIDKRTDKNIDAVLATLDQELAADHPELVEDQERGQSATTSPTLKALEQIRHPKHKTACATCPNSVWFASPLEVKCYCRVMYLVSWRTQEPNQITLCDGMFIG
jgi:hypothetical protein